MNLGTSVYAMFRGERGLVLPALLEPGIAGGEVLVRPLAESRPRPVPASSVLHLFTLDRNGEGSAYPFVALQAAAEAREAVRVAANVELPPVQMALKMSGADVHMATGYPVARATMDALRRRTPSLLEVRAVVLFAMFSANRGNGECEMLYYRAWPHIESGAIASMTDARMLEVFRSKVRTPGTKGGIGSIALIPRYVRSCWTWAEALHEALKQGYKDRELRRRIALNVGLPLGLGLIKLSFALELLGHNIACLDKHMLGILVGGATIEEAKARGEKIMSELSEKNSTKAAAERQLRPDWKFAREGSIAQYEKYEDLMVEDNEFYSKSDPMGYARCQWMTWETLRGEATLHDALFASIRAVKTGKPFELPPSYLNRLKRGAMMKWMRVRGQWVRQKRGEGRRAMHWREKGEQTPAMQKELKQARKEYRYMPKLIANPGEVYALYRDGKYQMAGSSADIAAFVHAHTSYSLQHALKHEGWSIRPIGQKRPNKNPRPRKNGPADYHMEQAEDAIAMGSGAADKETKSYYRGKLMARFDSANVRSNPRRRKNPIGEVESITVADGSQPQKALMASGWKVKGVSGGKAVMVKSNPGLSHKEKVALTRLFLGGPEALRTSEYRVAPSTIDSLMRKGFVDKKGLTNKGLGIAEAMGTKGPVSNPGRKKSKKSQAAREAHSALVTHMAKCRTCAGARFSEEMCPESKALRYKLYLAEKGVKPNPSAAWHKREEKIALRSAVHFRKYGDDRPATLYEGKAQAHRLSAIVATDWKTKDTAFETNPSVRYKVVASYRPSRGGDTASTWHHTTKADAMNLARQLMDPSRGYNTTKVAVLTHPGNKALARYYLWGNTWKEFKA